jgi:hypothetical protein
MRQNTLMCSTEGTTAKSMRAVNPPVLQRRPIMGGFGSALCGCVVTLMSIGAATTVRADVLCVKNSVKAAKTGKLNLASAISTASGSSCPAGSTAIINTATFIGPQGLQGPAGSQGQAGATGATGADGSALVFGSGAAGALTVSSNTTLTNGNTQFTDCTIASGATLTVGSGGVIRCTGNVTLNGTISASTGTFGPSDFVTSAGNSPGHQSPHPGLSTLGAAWGEFGTGAVFGGLGGMGLTSSGTFTPEILNPGTIAGGAGAGSITPDTGVGGDGGGSLVILAKGAVTIGASGVINANGGDGVSGGGGGAGGAIIIASQTSVTNNGLLSVKGGNGGASTSTAGAGGGGGGGLVHLLAPSVVQGSIVVTGGTAGSTSGAVSSTARQGGSGGGAFIGNGGNGSDVSAGNVQSGASDGGAGSVLSSNVDPTARLLF